MKTDNKNNGGSTDYYQINPEWKEAQDIIEDRNMNFAQGNILKAAFCFNAQRHESSSYERELNKIIWFANREKKRIKKEHLYIKQIKVGKDFIWPVF